VPHGDLKRPLKDFLSLRMAWHALCTSLKRGTLS